MDTPRFVGLFLCAAAAAMMLQYHAHWEIDAELRQRYCDMAGRLAAAEAASTQCLANLTATRKELAIAQRLVVTYNESLAGWERQETRWREIWQAELTRIPVLSTANMFVVRLADIVQELVVLGFDMVSAVIYSVGGSLSPPK